MRRAFPRSLAPFFLIVTALIADTGCTFYTYGRAKSARVTGTPRRRARRNQPIQQPAGQETLPEQDPEEPLGQKYELLSAGPASELSRLTIEPSDEFHPSLAPDGRTLLMTVRVRAGGRSVREYVGAIDTTLDEPPLETFSKGRVGREPWWMPDGSGYVMASDAAGTIGISRAHGAQPGAQVSLILDDTTAPTAGRPSVSPDGKSVAFHLKKKSGVYYVGTASIDGSNLTILGEGIRPSWSPDGRRIAFMRTVDGYNHIFVADLDASSVRQVTQGEYDHDFPAFSPNGRFLALSSNRAWDTKKDGSRKTVWNIHVVGTDGRGLTAVTEGDGEANAPSWGKDGAVYFNANAGGSFDIWRIKLTGDVGRNVVAQSPGSKAW